MSEKIAFASWNYICLVCSIHGEELILDEIKGRPIYRCSAEGCAVKISTDLYEKILEDVIAFQNKGEIAVGMRWRRRSESRVVEFTIVACANGKRPEISVRVY